MQATEFVGGREHWLCVPIVIAMDMANLDDVPLRLLIAFYLAEHERGQGVLLSVGELAESIGRTEPLTLAGLQSLSRVGGAVEIEDGWCLVPYQPPEDPGEVP